MSSYQQNQADHNINDPSDRINYTSINNSDSTASDHSFYSYRSRYNNNKLLFGTTITLILSICIVGFVWIGISAPKHHNHHNTAAATTNANQSHKFISHVLPGMYIHLLHMSINYNRFIT